MWSDLWVVVLESGVLKEVDIAAALVGSWIECCAVGQAEFDIEPTTVFVIVDGGMLYVPEKAAVL